MPNPKPKPVQWQNPKGTLISPNPDLLNDAYLDADDIGESIKKAVVERNRRIRQVQPSDERNSLPGGQMLTTHRAGTCIGYWCPIHNTSPHHMRTWNQTFDPMSKVMFRECQHGQLHPDPDDPFEFAAARDHAIDCDGCCKPSKHITRK